MNDSIKPGAVVVVFYDPITCERVEGTAKVKRVIRVEDWADVHGRTIVRCDVRFKDGVFERDVSELATSMTDQQAQGEQP